MNPKRIVIFTFVLALGVVFGALLAGPSNIALGQDNAERFVIAVPPSPCNVAVYSRIVAAEDGTATAGLIAFPPSPCTIQEADIVSFPEDTASCVETSRRSGARTVRCEFSAAHETTTFYFNASARD